MRFAAVAMLGAACFCSGSERASNQDASGLVSEVVRISVADARESGPGGNTGTVLVDRVSTARWLRYLTADSSAFPALLGDSSFRLSSKEEGIRCTSDVLAPCEVVNHGVFVSIDSIEVIGTSARVLVTSTTTERRISGRTALCGRQLLLRLEHHTTGWVTTEREVILQC